MVPVPDDSRLGCGLCQTVQIAGFALLQLAVLGLLKPRGYSWGYKEKPQKLNNRFQKPKDPVPED